MSFQAGVAKVNITPAIGCAMAGYAARKHGAVGIRDELWQSALSDGHQERSHVAGRGDGRHTAKMVGRVRRRVKS